MKATTSQTLFGLLVILFGSALLLDALNLFDFGSVLSIWWPMLIVIVGIFSLMTNPRNAIFAVTVIGAGLLLQLERLGVLRFDVGSLIFPTLVIAFGASLLFRRRGSEQVESSTDTSSQFAILCGVEERITTHDYKGGKVTALFGGVSLDLSKANIRDKAVLNVTTAFGGADIRVPESWNVVVSGFPLLGGWENKTRNVSHKKAPTLVVNATCVLGGFEIKN